MYYTAREKAINNGGLYHLAAILRRGKSVIKVGENTFKTHPRFKRIYPDGTYGSHMHADRKSYEELRDVIITLLKLLGFEQEDK